MASEERLVLVKLGGSLITHKAQPQTARQGVIDRLAREIGRSLAADPGLRLVVGHGSGSFGHVAAQRYGTRQGVRGPEDWQGFAQVAAAAARLNRIVTDRFLAAGVPAWSLQPSASARCRAGKLESLATTAVQAALAHGLVPLVYGDVALDEVLGGTIVSTEEILSLLARRLRPDCLVLAGAASGVYDRDPLLDPSAVRVPQISAANWDAVRSMLGGSFATDVTGGMLSKVEEMVALVQELPGLRVLITSGEAAGVLEAALRRPAMHGAVDGAHAITGTWIRW